MGNVVGEVGFCNWCGDDIELFDVEMIILVIESSGQMLFYVIWYLLLFIGVYCNLLVVWVNNFIELLFGGNWIVGW